MPDLNGAERAYEYQMVHEFYGTKVTSRSGVRKIHHVTEGVYILDRLGASMMAKRAFCIHPMVQDDAELAANFLSVVTNCDAGAVALALEYRNIANQYLSYRIIDSIDEIELSPLDSVNLMLMADKIQNRKDFDLYNRGKIPNSDRLDVYFANWLARLGISEEKYQEWVADILAKFPEHVVLMKE
jgi:hypothetical protein